MRDDLIVVKRKEEKNLRVQFIEIGKRSYELG